MRIAVIADTHGTFPPVLIEELRAADEIWHLGDFCDLATLNILQKIGPEYHAVLGNNDYGLDLPLRLRLQRGGKCFTLLHIPPSRIPTDTDYFLHGHTHVPRDEKVGSVRVLNPGTAGKADKGAPAFWAWMDVDEATGDVTWTLNLLPRRR